MTTSLRFGASMDRPIGIPNRSDVQVGTETTSETDGKGGVRARLVVVDVEIGGGRVSTAGASSLHRLQFNVPVEIPSASVGPLAASSRRFMDTRRVRMTTV